MPYSVLLLGATGYLGGDVLTTLEQAGNYEITCVVRPERKASFNGRKVSLLVVRLIASQSIEPFTMSTRRGVRS